MLSLGRAAVLGGAQFEAGDEFIIEVADDQLSHCPMPLAIVLSKSQRITSAQALGRDTVSTAIGASVKSLSKLPSGGVNEKSERGNKVLIDLVFLAMTVRCDAIFPGFFPFRRENPPSVSRQFCDP